MSWNTRETTTWRAESVISPHLSLWMAETGSILIRDTTGLGITGIRREDVPALIAALSDLPRSREVAE